LTDFAAASIAASNDITSLKAIPAKFE